MAATDSNDASASVIFAVPMSKPVPGNDSYTVKTGVSSCGMKKKNG